MNIEKASNQLTDNNIRGVLKKKLDGAAFRLEKKNYQHLTRFFQSVVV